MISGRPAAAWGSINGLRHRPISLQGKDLHGRRSFGIFPNICRFNRVLHAGPLHAHGRARMLDSLKSMPMTRQPSEKSSILVRVTPSRQLSSENLCWIKVASWCLVNSPENLSPLDRTSGGPSLPIRTRWQRISKNRHHHRGILKKLLPLNGAARLPKGKRQVRSRGLLTRPSHKFGCTKDTVSLAKNTRTRDMNS